MSTIRNSGFEDYDSDKKFPRFCQDNSWFLLTCCPQSGRVGLINEDNLEMALCRHGFEQAIGATVTIVWCDQQVAWFEQLAEQCQSCHSR